MRLAKKIISMAMTAALVLGMTAANVPEKVSAAGGYRNVVLGAGAITPASGSTWNKGDLTVYYGSYNGSSMQYRVLKAEDGRILLDCNSSLYNSDMKTSLITYNNTWNNSTLRTSLNGSDFYGNASVFNAVEKNAIVSTSNPALTNIVVQSGAGSAGVRGIDDAADDYIFLLSAQEINDLYRNNSETRESNVWTRTYVSGSNLVYLNTVGTLKTQSYAASAGVSPAFNINESAVAFTTTTGTNRSSFAATSDASTYNWTLALYDGAGFNASLAGSSNVNAGGSVSININGLASGNTNSYNQISAILYDSNGVVTAYGRIGNVSAGNISVTIPSNVTNGSCKLYVFEECAPSSSTATSYVSNMSEISINVSGATGNSSANSGSSNSSTTNYSNTANSSSTTTTTTTEDTSKLDCKWNASGVYWYEGGVRQGIYGDAKNVVYDGTERGREIYDPLTDAWYWLDAIYDGAKAVSKEVFMPYVYQDEIGCDLDAAARETLAALSNIEGKADMSEQVNNAIKNKKGKWVRYDANGGMIKGWYTVEGEDAEIYPTQVGNTYYYDWQTGLMAKGWTVIEGKSYYFDEDSGVLQK